MVKQGVVVGRFQPFHNGHLQYVLKALERCGHLYIGITTPGETATQYEPSDPTRLGLWNNPFSYDERVEMITAALQAEQVNQAKTTFVHFNPSDLAAWYKAVPHDATYFLLLIGDEQKKVDEMRTQGLVVEVLDTVTDREETSGQIRQAMQTGQTWKHMVPDAVAAYLQQIDAVKRIGNYE